MIAYFYWDISPSIFSWNLPLLGRPLLWYGLFFAVGFFLAYFLMIFLLKDIDDLKLRAQKITDQISLYLLIGILAGARLFDVLFYENLKQFFHDPFFFIRFWEGGLSSHGAVMGLILATFVYQRKHRHLRFLYLLDLLSIVAGVAAACIRVGNFFNQEILGLPTNLPWAVVFGHPADGSFPTPRHPTQLYEAFYYLMIFGVMWQLKDRLRKWGEGRLCGLFLMLVFVFRFFIELYKEEQSVWIQASPLKMGQWLTISFIFLGMLLFFRKKKKAVLGQVE